MESAIHPCERRGSDRRRRRLSLVLHERRSGFDRRMCDSRSGRSTLDRLLLGLRSRPNVVLLTLVAVNLLNLADYLLTLHCLAMGGGEANPLMAALLHMGSAYAGMFKLMAVFVAAYTVWRFRRHRASLEAAVVMSGVFAALLVYHLVGLAVFA